MPYLTKLIAVNGLDTPAAGEGLQNGRWRCQQLEEGNILFFPRIPFDFPGGEREFLLSQRQSNTARHKNIAYRPGQDRLTGFVKRTRKEEEALRVVMRAYCERATRFLSLLLPQYAAKWKLDFASFRPEEEEGRAIRLRARNDLLHVDSFPTRPTNGDRILRFFANINPSSPRVWLTGETFEGLAERLARPGASRARVPAASQAGQGALEGTHDLLPRAAESVLARTRHSFLRLAQGVGLRMADPSPYDRFMHRFHNYMKQNQAFQEASSKLRWEFPPGSSWIAFTDMVSHAVVSGQFALEQTYIISRDSLVLPHKAPIAILENVVGRPLSVTR